MYKNSENIFKGEENKEVIVNIGIGPEGEWLDIKTSELIANIQIGCFNCLNRDEFSEESNGNIYVGCIKHGSTHPIEYNCGNDYKKDEAGVKEIKDLIINLEK